MSRLAGLITAKPCGSKAAPQRSRLRSDVDFRTTRKVWASRTDQPKRHSIMREIRASDAKTHLPQILDEVERGETVRITRHGRPTARIVPEPHRRQEEVGKAIESIKGLRERTGRVTPDELLSARHAGHKY